MKKKYLLIVSLALCLITTACQKKESNLSETAEPVKGTENNEALIDSGLSNNKENSLNSIPDTEKVVREVSTDFKKVLESQSLYEILMYNEDDFDGDGNIEAFAFLGNRDNEGDVENTYNGELWFVNASGAKLLEPYNNYWNINKTYTIKNKEYIILSQYFPTGDLSYIWTVENSEAQEASISKKVSGFSVDDDCITVIQDRYDGDSTGGGHTWKTYYLFMDDNGEFREYGGVEISKEQLLKFNYASEIIDGIEAEGYQIKNIIYRENGIIHINYVSGTTQGNSTLIYNDDTVQVIDRNDGVYDLAMLEDIAVYPTGVNIPE